MDEKRLGGEGGQMHRRDFLKTAAVAGAALAAAPRIVRAENLKTDTLNCAVIGAGNECRVLLSSCVKIPGLQFKGVCDIWPYHRGYTSRLLKAYHHQPKEYATHREMLADLKDLDAVIVASPDWVHAEHAIAAMNAGLHVYCEKEMSNTIDKAREMVLTSRKTGKMLQIGHQRRSNPRYHMALNYIRNVKVIGRPTSVGGNWNRHKMLQQEWKRGTELGKEDLEKFGYDTMDRFRNWRWYRKFSGGPIADLGSHQIDIFHWFLGARPRAVMADGGIDNYKTLEWYDNVLAVYEWDVPWDGQTWTVRGFYQLLSTSSHGGYAENFLGTEGSLVISEGLGKGGIRREYAAPMAAWERELAEAVAAKAASLAELRSEVDMLKKKLAKLEKQHGGAPDPEPKKTIEEELKVGHSTPEPGRYYPPIPSPAEPTTEHMPHLANFFEAIRKGDPKHLNCPGEVGYETAVSVLKVNEAVAAARKIEFKPDDFKA